MQDRDPVLEKKPGVPGFVKALGVLLLVVGACVGLFYYIFSSLLGDLISENSPITQFTKADAQDQVSREQFRVVAESHDDPYLGNKDADIVIVKFMDLGCPFCAQEAPIIDRLIKKYSQEIKIIFRDFPLEELHPGATEAAIAANCAHQQDMYWPMAKRLYEEQGQLDILTFDRHAQDLGLDMQKYESCVESDITLKEIRSDQSDALAVGVRQTPVFYINGNRVAGAITYEAFERIIDTTLLHTQ